MKKRILIIVISVLVLSYIIIQASYAIFRATTNASGSVKTSNWQVELNQTGVNNHISVIPGDSTSISTYTVNITSNSEVDALYSIIVDGIPSGVTVALDTGTFETPTNNKVIFGNVGRINYSDTNKTKTHTLSFKADSSTTYVVDSELDVNVVARQVLPTD